MAQQDATRPNLIVGGVVTTIHAPNETLNALNAFARARDTVLHIVGDVTTPSEPWKDFTDYYDLRRQASEFPSLAELLPFRHYARKNIGYLAAFRSDCEWLYETDDDNVPLTNPFEPRQLAVSGCRPLDERSWINFYPYFLGKETAKEPAPWPRGFPLAALRGSHQCEEVRDSLECPIQQGLANGEPDVDAIFRLTVGGQFQFEERDPLLLNPKHCAPLNSQSTWWHRSHYRLMFLPTTCSFRVTDILRGYIAMVLLQVRGSSISYHSPVVRQDRNAHDLYRDLADEVWLYSNIEETVEEFASTVCPTATFSENLTSIYEYLVQKAVLEEADLASLNAWLACCNELGIDD